MFSQQEWFVFVVLFAPALALVFRGKRPHTATVTSVAWWPWDTGLFVSTGFDEAIHVWDTNQLTVRLPFASCLLSQHRLPFLSCPACSYF
jgi:WD40 repeat protein